MTNVKFDENGRPLLASSAGYSGLTRKQKQHTKYFVELNFTQTSLPQMKKPVSASVHQFFRPASAAPRPASAASIPALDQSADEPAFGEEVSENDADEKDSEDGTDLGSSSEAESDHDVVATTNGEHQENELMDIEDIDEVEEDLNNNAPQGAEGLGTSLAKEVSDKILASWGITDGMTLKETIAEAVATRLAEKKSDDDGVIRGDWIEGGNGLTCATCLHLDTLQITKALKLFRKGNFGVITNKSPY